MSGLIQRSFAGGEIAPALYGRADQVKYTTGLVTCRNFFVERHGGVSNRQGSQFIAEVKDSSKRTYFLKFIFNDAQTYVIEAGDRYFRFYREGARIIVSGVAAWNGATAYVAGDLVLSGGVNYYCVFAHTNHVPPNATYWYALTGVIYEVPTPYLAADLANLKTDQSGDVVTITHQGYIPAELRRTGHTAWTLAGVVTAPSIAAPTGQTATPGAAGAFNYDYVITAVKAETYEESIASAVATAAATAVPTTALPIALGWAAVTGAVQYNVYLDRYGNGIYGFVETASDVSFNDTGLTPDLSTTPPIARTLFASTGNYPKTSSYFQQRHVFASTALNPETAWASRSGAFKNFTISSPSQDDDAVTFNVSGKKVNSIEHLIELGRLIALTGSGEWVIKGDSDGVLRPQAINPSQQGYRGASSVSPVIAGDSLLYVQALASIVRDLRFDVTIDGYTGNDVSVFAVHLFRGFQIQRMDYAEIPDSIAWCIRDDGTLLGLTYMREQQIAGWHRHDTDGLFEDVCVVPEGNEHVLYVMVKRTINGSIKRYVERIPSRLITDVVTDARFLDSYLEYDGRNTGSTTMTLTGEGWTISSTLTLTASAGFFVAGDVGNVIALEADGAVLRVEITAYTSATVVSVKPERTAPVAFRNVAIPVWTKCVDELAGLGHLEGKTVSILGDGNVLPQEVVTSGAITLARCYGIIAVGLPIEADVESLDLDFAGADIRGKQKHVASAQLLVEKTRGVFVGPDVGHLEEYKPDIPEAYGEIPALLTGLIDLNIAAEWSDRGRIVVRQSDPLPITLLSLITNASIGG